MRRVICISLSGFIVLMFAVAGGSTDAGELHEAVRENDILKVDAVLEKSGAGVVNSTVNGGVTPLHLAAELNRRVAAGLLITRGADVNARTTAGVTPLHAAAGSNAVDTAKLLIALGADVNARDRNGATPLQWAANSDAADAIRLLLTSGARVRPEKPPGPIVPGWAEIKKTDFMENQGTDIFTVLS